MSSTKVNCHGERVNSVKKRFLITGGTGFLGKEVVSGLRKNSDFELDIISRGSKAELKGDLSKWNAGLDLQKLKSNKYDVFLHMAALYDLKATRVEIFNSNVAGTNTALKIAQELEIPIFINTSSIAAATNFTKKEVTAYEIDLSSPFPDPYAESKALNEEQIKNWNNSKQLKLNLRLGILVGHSQTGRIERLDGPYAAAPVFQKLKNWITNWPFAVPLPGNADVRMPFVPIDSAAYAVTKMCEWSLANKSYGYKSFHIVPENGVSAIDFYQSALDHFQILDKKFNLVSKIPKPILGKISQLLFGFPEEQLKYLLSLPRFNSLETREILGPKWCPEFDSYKNVFWSGYEKYISNR